jgi:hypothetical protein
MLHGFHARKFTDHMERAASSGFDLIMARAAGAPIGMESCRGYRPRPGFPRQKTRMTGGPNGANMRRRCPPNVPRARAIQCRHRMTGGSQFSRNVSILLARQTVASPGRAGGFAV